ncbi:hypothetical protein [Pedobacter sp.]|uniref:hypothetical protein n=1 Tax=Pedobacter sp. TaxID=1411316 RepID=UPI003D7F99F9
MEENQEVKKRIDPTSSAALITAPEHQLRRVMKHHHNLRDNRGGRPSATGEKAQLFSNKTHYNPHNPDAVYSTIY